ncbi:hypothetical protein LP7551_01804 [Roseibium album]|nr:hypothetical protein LP7551_01804 [Roseibium album]
MTGAQLFTQAIWIPQEEPSPICSCLKTCKFFLVHLNLKAPHTIPVTELR